MTFRPSRLLIVAAILVLLAALGPPAIRAAAPLETAALTPPATYLTSCASEGPPLTCFAIDGFIAPDVQERTTWVLINDSDAPASFWFYLYDETDAVTTDEITGTATITPGGVFVYPGLFRIPLTTAHPLTGVFTSTAAMTVQVVGPTTRCPRHATGYITCAEIRVPSGATTYSFYNFQESSEIVWIHQLYLDGVAQPPYSDIMSGPEVKQYPTGISEGLRTSAAAEPRFKALAHQYQGGPFPPPFMGWKQFFPFARR
jgi:hypothetical protein